MSKPELPKCVNCQCEYTYESQDMYICPECSHEWSKKKLSWKKMKAKMM